MMRPCPNAGKEVLIENKAKYLDVLALVFIEGRLEKLGERRQLIEVGLKSLWGSRDRRKVMVTNFWKDSMKSAPCSGQKKWN